MTGAETLLTLGRVNLAAAAAILLVLVLRAPVRRRLGARLTYAMWLLPLMAMAGALAPVRQVLVQRPYLNSSAGLPSGLPGDTTPDLWSSLQPGADAARAWPALDMVSLALVLWVAGALMAMLVMAHLQRRFTREARNGAIGPAVVGVVSPRIVTPHDFSTRFEPEEQALVIAHEQAHIARQDSRLNGLAAALQCLFWFNPLIHIAIRHMRVDQELACDEAVVTRFPGARSAYARALVKTQLANRPLPLGCYWPSGTEHPLLERIAMLKTADIGARRRLVGATTLTLLCAAAGVTAWAASPPKVTYESAPAQGTEGFVAVEQPAREGFVPVEPNAAVLISAASPAPTRSAERPAFKGAPGGAPERIVLAQAEPAPTLSAPPSGGATQEAIDAAAARVGGKVTYVGEAKIPPYTAFVRYFDGNSPVLVKGRVTEVRMPDGERGELIVAAEDGKTYRVLGGSTQNLSLAQKAQIQDAAGQVIVARGYLAHDKTCVGGCLMDGVKVTHPDGRDLVTMSATPTPAPAQ